jgi:hypothetical protein
MNKMYCHGVTITAAYSNILIVLNSFAWHYEFHKSVQRLSANETFLSIGKVNFHKMHYINNSDYLIINKF